MLDAIEDRTSNALEMYETSGAEGRLLVAAGGVAANSALRARLGELAGARGYRFAVPPQRYCTDNGAMIALAGLEKLNAGDFSQYSTSPRARWPLDEDAAAARPTHASGRKGPKA
jgi:N6-L-threonylcarbamoyladenine synthase